MRYPQLAPTSCCRPLDMRGDQKHLCRVLQCSVVSGLCSVAGAAWFRSVGKQSILGPFSHGVWEECVHLDTQFLTGPNPLLSEVPSLGYWGSHRPWGVCSKYPPLCRCAQSKLSVRELPHTCICRTFSPPRGNTNERLRLAAGQPETRPFPQLYAEVLGRGTGLKGEQ